MNSPACRVPKNYWTMMITVISTERNRVRWGMMS